MTPALDFRNVTVSFGHGRSEQVALDDVSLSLYAHETLGLAGESGSGKSTLGRAALRLVPLKSGSVSLFGEQITGQIPGNRRRALPGKVQMIFQDPMASLNERARVSHIVTEGRYALPDPPKLRERDALARAALASVGLDPSMADRYPHAFSGGQRQRIAIARALLMEPSVLLCDEPVSALDVSARAQVINLISRVKAERGLAVLFIAHDLSLMRYFCDRIAILYRGRIVEAAETDELFARPIHPYTRTLLASMPAPDTRVKGKRVEPRAVLSGG